MDGEDRNPRQQGNERLYQTVARRITRLIEENAGNVDWRMPSERELAEELQVSRPVVREAIIALEMRGLVEVRGRAGIVVLAPKTAIMNFDRLDADIGPGPFEWLDARMAVESSAASFAAERVTTFDLSFLEDLIHQMEVASHDPSLSDRADKADRDFHIAITRMSGNALLASMTEALWDQRDKSPMWRKLHENVHMSSVQPLWIGDHYAILAALRLRHKDAAYKAMARHIKNVTTELMEAEEGGRDSLQSEELRIAK